MEAPPLKRKLAAILAADVAGYSRLMEADEEATLATLSAHRSIVDAAIGRHRGHIAGTAGDSVLAEFDSVFDAVHAAIEIQGALADANTAFAEDRRMEFRIGINVGDVMLKDGDIFGDGVNIAARLEGLARPGGICVSRGVRDYIRYKTPVRFEDLGEQSVKNIARPVRAFHLLPNGRPEPMEDGAGNSHNDPPHVDEVELQFWDSIKHSTSTLEYQVYLERYPDGAFATLATARLRSLARGTVPFAPPNGGAGAVDPKAIELAFWETVTENDTAEMYRAYLDKYPEGEFAPLAERKLAADAAPPG